MNINKKEIEFNLNRDDEEEKTHTHTNNGKKVKGLRSAHHLDPILAPKFSSHASQLGVLAPPARHLCSTFVPLALI